LGLTELKELMPPENEDINTIEIEDFLLKSEKHNIRF